MRVLLNSPAPIFFCVEYNVATALCIALAKLRNRRTIIFQEHRGREGLRLSSWDRTYRRVLASLSDALIANTDGALAELTTDLRIDRRKIYRAMLLVPPERAALAQEPAQLPRPQRRPLFLFVGKLVRRKNLTGLLRAATTLRAEGLPFELWIVGDGPERLGLEAQARVLTRDGSVRFLGPLAPSKVGAAYEAADLFVMPSLRDYRSVAVLEAMRFGTPAIDSVHDGNAGDLVRHNVTGLLFDPSQHEALANAMRRAILDPEFVKQLAQRASGVMTDFTPHSAAIALRDIVRAVQPGPI